MHTEQLIHELSNGLIGWYQFQKGVKALYVSDDTRDFEFWADVYTGHILDSIDNYAKVSTKRN